MPIENERKYVLQLNLCQSKFAGYKSYEIKQSYVLLGKRRSLRIREIYEKGCAPQYLMTFKQNESSFNREIEVAISQEDYSAINETCKIKLYKKRYCYEGWEIDFFLNEKGEVYFVQAEIEMPEDMSAPAEIPPLISENLIYTVGRNDNRFSSRRLANPRHARKLLNKISVK